MIYCIVLQDSKFALQNIKQTLSSANKRFMNINSKQLTSLTMHDETSKAASHLPLLGAYV